MNRKTSTKGVLQAATTAGGRQTAQRMVLDWAAAGADSWGEQQPGYKGAILREPLSVQDCPENDVPDKGRYADVLGAAFHVLHESALTHAATCRHTPDPTLPFLVEGEDLQFVEGSSTWERLQVLQPGTATVQPNCVDEKGHEPAPSMVVEGARDVNGRCVNVLSELWLQMHQVALHAVRGRYPKTTQYDPAARQKGTSTTDGFLAYLDRRFAHATMRNGSLHLTYDASRATDAAHGRMLVACSLHMRVWLRTAHG
eukprot:1566038-Amphidinium_carterae.1